MAYRSVVGLVCVVDQTIIAIETFERRMKTSFWNRSTISRTKSLFWSWQNRIRFYWLTSTSNWFGDAVLTTYITSTVTHQWSATENSNTKTKRVVATITLRLLGCRWWSHIPLGPAGSGKTCTSWTILASKRTVFTIDSAGCLLIGNVQTIHFEPV